MRVVTLEHISFAYSTSCILRHIFLAVERGERLGVLGPNGSGISVLLKMVYGALIPERGRAQTEACVIGTLRQLDRARLIAVVPEAHHVILPFAAEGVMLMGRTAYLGGGSFES
jgi:iron complex transport system ATP-binding protein